MFVDRNTKNDAEHVALNFTCYLQKQLNFLKERAMDYFSQLNRWRSEGAEWSGVGLRTERDVSSTNAHFVVLKLCDAASE